MKELLAQFMGPDSMLGKALSCHGALGEPGMFNRPDLRAAELPAANGVGDFDTARATYTKIYDQVTADLFTTRSQMATDRAKLAEINRSLGQLSPEMSVERNLDLSIPSRILALRQQRQEMLARYLPDAQPIKDLDAPAVNASQLNSEKVIDLMTQAGLL